MSATASESSVPPPPQALRPVPARSVYVGYGHTLDPASWAERHARGEVPDLTPYGLHRLAAHGFEPVIATNRRQGRLAAARARAFRGASGKLEGPDLLRDRRRRRACDAVLAWDERTGAPAALRAKLRGEPPVASGVLWLTEPGATATVRGRAAARALASADAVWVTASAQLDVLAGWGIPRPRLHFLPLGIDADFWRVDAEPEPRLLVAAGNDRHRDHGLVVEAALRARRREPRVRLELASRHPVEVPAHLGVRHPSLGHEALRAVYGRASAVVLALKPNLHLSGLTVLLEAMACGRPVIATETPGMRDYVEDGVTGYLVPRDADALAEAVLAVLAEPEAAREVGAAARRSVERRFTTEHLAAGIARVLETLPPRRPGTR